VPSAGSQVQVGRWRGSFWSRTSRLQSLASSDWLSSDEVAELDQLIGGTGLGQGVVVFKIWSRDGRVVYSPDRALIGRQFALNNEFQKTLEGEVVADISSLDKAENERERARWSRLMEV